MKTMTRSVKGGLAQWFMLMVLLGPAGLFAAGSKEAEPESSKEKKDSAVDKLGWKAGPITGDLRSRAKIQVPQGFRFLEHGDAAKLLVMAGNQSSGKELGLVQNIKDKWWAVFEFEDVGYVKDDDKDKLDADKLLNAIRAGTEEGNKYRSEHGIPTMNIVGWHVKPNYNEKTKNLEWSILAESEGKQFVNYNVRLLGRKGVTEITLVDDVDSVNSSLPGFRELIANFTYTTGESYAEFRPGDKVAKYGLGALVVGGAAAVAYKLGFFGVIFAFIKKAWKLVVVSVAFIASAIKKLITGDSARRRTE